MSDNIEQSVVVQITGDASGLVAAQKTASDAVASSSTSMTASLAQVAASSTATQIALASLSGETQAMSAVNDAAGSSFSSLGDLIRQKGSLMRTEGRFASFIARDISSMGVASKAVAGDIGGLVSAFAIGGGIGLAAEGVKLLVEALMSGDTEIKKFADDADKALEKTQERADSILASMRGASQGEVFQHEEVSKLLKQEFDQKQALGAASVKMMEAEAKLASTDQELRKAAYAQAVAAVSASSDNYEKLKQELEITQKLIAAKRVRVGDVDTQETSNAAQKQADQDQKIAIEQNMWLLKAHAALLGGQEKLDADYEIELQQIQDNSNLSTEQKAARMSAALQAYAKADLDYRNKLEAEWSADLQKWTDANIKAQAQAREALKRLTDDQAAYQVKRAEDVSKEQTKQLQETFALTKSIAGGIGSAMSGIITNTESVGKAIVSMASVAIKALIDLAIKSVEASAVKAGGEAASAEAGIPIVGPALAVGAMVAMEALVLGLLSSIPSSAGGLDRVPQDTLAFIHKDETVMSAPLAETFRQAAAGGGIQGGGGEMHLHFHTLDPQSAATFLGSPEMQRQFQNLRRTGRFQ